MDIGALRDRITIQSQSTTQDAIGEPVQAWVEVATVWASVRDLTGREFLAAQAAQNTVQTKILIRHRAGIVPAMRVLRGTTIYNVEAVLNASGRPDYLVLMCSKGAGDA